MPIVEAVVPTFFVQDARASIEWYVRVLGFQVEFDTGTYAGMREATVRDPDGNDIYIGQPLPAAPR